MRFSHLVELTARVASFAIAFGSLGSLGCSSGAADANVGAVESGALACAGVAVERGSLGGNHTDACDGLARADGVHVAWQSGSPATSAIVSYASNLLPADIASLQIDVRYRGDDGSEPLWQWHAKNVNGSWDLVGDNAWASNWVFTNHTFTIANPKDYLDANGKLQIRFTSETNTKSAELDLLAVTATRGSAASPRAD
jgi:hypothetical protein